MKTKQQKRKEAEERIIQTLKEEKNKPKQYQNKRLIDNYEMGLEAIERASHK